MMTHRDNRSRADAQDVINDVPVTTSNDTRYHKIRLTHRAREENVLLLIRDKDHYLEAFRRGDHKWFQFNDYNIEGFQKMEVFNSHAKMSPGQDRYVN